MEVSKEIKESVNNSLIYAKIITMDLCREPAEDPEPPTCVPAPTPETAVCKPQEATSLCVTSAAVGTVMGLVMDAQEDDFVKKENACK